jgi:hypothetical protein
MFYYVMQLIKALPVVLSVLKEIKELKKKK